MNLRNSEAACRPTEHALAERRDSSDMIHLNEALTIADNLRFAGKETRMSHA
jgi:hypothetical protein